MRLIEKLIEWLSTHRRKPGVRERTRPLKSRWDVVLGYCMHTRVSTGEVPPGCPAVVLVHGLGVSSRYMVPTGERLAPYCHVYAPDLPGWGRSERPPHALTIGEMADVLNAWMDVFGVRRAVFVGNSLGCQVIVELAVRYPGRVERAVLTGPTFDRKARDPIRYAMRLLFDMLFEPPLYYPIVVYDYLSMGIIRYLLTLRNGLKDRIEEKLPRVRVPMLVVRGEHDRIVPMRWAKEVAELLPAGRLIVVPGSAHPVNYQAPGKLARLVISFACHGAARRVLAAIPGP